jgi:hypothetical protein
VKFDAGFYASGQAAFVLGEGASVEVTQDLSKVNCKGQGLDVGGSVGWRAGLGAELSAGWRLCVNYGF